MLKSIKPLLKWMQDIYGIPAEQLAKIYPASLGKMNEPMPAIDADTLLLRDSQDKPIDQTRFAALVRKYGVKPGERLWRGSNMGADDLHTTIRSAPSKEAKWTLPSDGVDAAAGYIAEGRRAPLLMQFDVDDSVRAVPGWHFGFSEADIDPRYIDAHKSNELEWILPRGTFTESPQRVPIPHEFDMNYAAEALDKKTLDRLITLRMKLKQKARGGSVVRSV